MHRYQLPDLYGAHGIQMNDFGSDLVKTSKIHRDDKNLAVLAHLLPLFGFLVPGLNMGIPLVIWLLKRDKSMFIEHHARESLNFQITFSVLCGAWTLLTWMLVGLLLLPLVPVVLIVVLLFMFRAAMKAGKGEFYCYPVTLRLVS